MVLLLNDAQTCAVFADAQKSVDALFGGWFLGQEVVAPRDEEEAGAPWLPPPGLPPGLVRLGVSGVFGFMNFFNKFIWLLCQVDRIGRTYKYI